MDFHYDTVIIGAGPAGTACGIQLQKQGARVCVIDKATFPRSKTCAGLVTHKTLLLIRQLLEGPRYTGSSDLDAHRHVAPTDPGASSYAAPTDPGASSHAAPTDLHALFCDRTSEVRLFQRTRCIVTAPIHPEVHFVHRRDFDNALVREYLALGGILLENMQNYTIDFPAGVVHLASGDSLHYHTLVLADGALSQAHKLLGLEKSVLAFGIETAIPREYFPVDSVNLYFDYTKSGYIWAFPHGDSVCVGAVDRYQKQVNFQNLLTPFLANMGLDPQAYRYAGAFLPYGYVVPQEKLPENVLLAGDAAGLADPISGEGLYMALKSGMLAAQALTAMFPKAEYLRSIHFLQDVVKEGHQLQALFYKPMNQRIFLRKAAGNQRFVSFFFDHQVSQYGYRYRQMMQLYRDYKRS